MTSRFKLHTLEDLELRPQPETLIPDCLLAGDLLVATGDHRYFNQLGRILGPRALAFHVSTKDRRDTITAWIDHGRRREGSPAVLVHFPDNHPDLDPCFNAFGDVVIDAETSVFAKVIKLRNFDSSWKALRLRGRVAVIEERF